MQVRWRIASDGWLALALFGLLTICLTFLDETLGAFSLGLMIWLGYILRVPRRHAPDDARAIVSPADGKIIAIDDVAGLASLEQAGANGEWATRITVATAITDAHLQVAPVQGRIIDNFLVPGLFLPLDDLDVMRSDNERREIIIETEQGMRIMLVHYGSRYARWLVCALGEGKFIRRGMPLGMLLMAGVTDIYLPSNVRLNVTEHQSLLGGETIIAMPKAA
ncbi:phosphatidylserine decarboxylase [Alphaproteobacteria bacterium]|nr:phosphatidylserine decarboxylase [Alphaproteobacteria bacterium]